MDSKSFPLVTVLTLIFLTLKLIPNTIVSDWSWWWVFSPIWISFGLVIVFSVIVGMIAGVRTWRDDRRKKRSYAD